MSDDRYSLMTDEDLEKELSQMVIAPAVKAAKARQNTPVDNEDYTAGMSGPQLALAGVGKKADDIIQGLKEIGVGAFGTKEEIAASNAAKKEKRAIDSRLMKNWPANMGGFGFDAALALSTPARIGAQMGTAGLQAAMSPTEGDIDGVMLGTRGMRGLESGVTTGVMGLPIAATGKTAGGVFRRYNDMGKETMPLADSARRLGIDPTMGSVDPLSVFHTIEAGYAGTPKMTAKQLKAFETAADRTVNAPTGVIGQPESRVLHGDNIRQEIVGAGEALKGKGSELWKGVDDYITSNNLPNVLTPDSQNTARTILNQYGQAPRGRTAQQLPSQNNALYYIKEADDASGTGMKAFRDMATAKGISHADFTSLHELQSVIGRAKELARQAAESSDQKAAAKMAVRELDSMYASISADVDRWGVTNPTAMKMVTEAKNFWRENVVPGTINNDLFMKANRGTYGAKDNAYKEAHRFYSDLANKPTELSWLHPYMSQNGQDMVNTFQLIPELSRVLKNPGNNLTANGVGNLRVASGIVAKNPKDIVFGLAGHMPGFEGATTSPAVQRFMMGRNLLREEVPSSGGLGQLKNLNVPGRAAWSVLQYPQQDAEETLRGLRTRTGK
jgi:hypothetical protein